MQKSAKDMWDVSNRPWPPHALDAGDLRAALDAFATREMLDYGAHGRCHSDVWVCGFGVTLWLMGDTQGAVKFWSKACDEAIRGKFKYSSTGTFQPGLLLWFASVWLKKEELREEAVALFERLFKKRQPIMGWGPSISIARFLCRQSDDVGTSVPWLFYGGVRAYDDGDIAKTRRLWAQADHTTSDSLLFERYLLVHEERQLSNKRTA